MDDAPRSESPERPAPGGDDPQPDFRSEVRHPEPGLPWEVEHPQRMAYPTTNGTAIMALVSTLVPFPVVGGVLGIILGIFGLREIHRHGQTGSAIAVAAIIVGSIQLALIIISPIVLSYFGARVFGTRV